MKKSFVWVFLVIFLLLGCLAGCGNQATPTEPTTEPTYTVTFQDWDGTVISTNTYKDGDKVVAPADPKRPADNTYTYAFAGWDKEIVACAGDATYTATYDTEYIDYTVTFKNWDGTVISTATYHYGDAVTVPADPTRPATKESNFTFAGWDGTATSCKGNATYTARYNEEKKLALQVWALVGEEYESVDKIQANVWLWMMRAAMVEWAHINDVNLQFVSNFDKSSLMAAITAGAKPDFIFTMGEFPQLASFGLVQPLTEAQSAKIAEVIGDSWFVDWRSKHYGVQAPWAGTKMVYYNETMMKNYGVKTPKAYIEEGNWTWENYLEICRQCTKDLNDDGVMDTWGSTTYSVDGGWAEAFTVDPQTGLLQNNMESEGAKAWLNTLYDAVVTNPGLINTDAHAYVAGSGIAMSIADGEPYNFYHTYQTLENGDVICAVQLPTRYADDAATFQCATWQFAIPRGSDQSDAATDMLCYILQAGMKWMADHSEGLMETDYEGIVGATEYSAAWLEKYNAYLKERHAQYADVKATYGEEIYADMLEAYLKGNKHFDGTYPGVYSPWQGAGDFDCIFTLPPVTSQSKLSATMKAKTDYYNYPVVY